VSSRLHGHPLDRTASRRPSARTRARPALTRSWMRLRSNSARAGQGRAAAAARPVCRGRYSRETHEPNAEFAQLLESVTRWRGSARAGPRRQQTSTPNRRRRACAIRSSKAGRGPSTGHPVSTYSRLMCQPRSLAIPAELEELFSTRLIRRRERYRRAVAGIERHLQKHTTRSSIGFAGLSTGAARQS